MKGIKKKKIFWLFLGSLLFLSGCQGKATTANSTKKEEVTQSTVSSSKQEETTKESAEKKEKEALLWNDEKKQQLKSFMTSWGTTMGQTYQEFQPGNNVNYYGVEVPDGLLQNLKMAVNGIEVPKEWWQETGNKSSYQIVAVYSDVNAGQQPFHLYLFTLKDGVPEVLICKDTGYYERQGLNFAPTENQELKAGFTKIIGETHTKDQAKSTTATPSVPGYSAEEVLAARFYLTITQQTQKAADGVTLQLFGYPKDRKVATSETITFPTVTYTLSATPLASGEWTFSEEKNGTVKYYRLPKNYRDPQWMDATYADKEAQRILDEAQTITLGDYSQESLRSVLESFEK